VYVTISAVPSTYLKILSLFPLRYLVCRFRLDEISRGGMNRPVTCSICGIFVELHHQFFMCLIQKCWYKNREIYYHSLALTVTWNRTASLRDYGRNTERMRDFGWLKTIMNIPLRRQTNSFTALLYLYIFIR